MGTQVRRVKEDKKKKKKTYEEEKKEEPGKNFEIRRPERAVDQGSEGFWNKERGGGRAARGTTIHKKTGQQGPNKKKRYLRKRLPTIIAQQKTPKNPHPQKNPKKYISTLQKRTGRSQPFG